MSSAQSCVSNLTSDTNEDIAGLVVEPKKRKCSCLHKEKPWEQLKDEMPDFSDDPSGKKEYMWKLNTLKKLSPGKVTLSVIWGMVMAMLDMSIVSVALPNMTAFFGKSSSEIQWVSDGYSIFLAAFAIIAGKVGDKFGAVNVNHVAMLLFMIFSVTCSLANQNNYWLLVVSRILQGSSASFLLSTTMSLLTTLVKPTDISTAMAWNGAITTVAVAIGPFLGGLLVDLIGWQIIFLINVPIGITGIIITVYLLPATPKLKEKKFDFMGAILTLLFLSLMIIGITRLVETPLIGVILLVISVLLIWGFCEWEKRFICPMMPTEVLFNYRVITSLLSGLCSFATMSINSYQGPFMLQFCWGYSPIISGLCTLPNSVLSGVVSVIVGRLCKKYSALFLRTIANIISFAGLLVICFSGFGGVACLIIGSCIIGIGLGTYVTASNTYIMVITPINAKGTMGGCVQCFRETGFSLGIALSCMFQDTIYKMIWGDDVPSGEIMPDDFRETYIYTYMFMCLCFMAVMIVGSTLTQVSGCHPYELEAGFKRIPKKFIPGFQKHIDDCHERGVNALGFPLQPRTEETKVEPPKEE